MHCRQVLNHLYFCQLLLVFLLSHHPYFVLRYGIGPYIEETIVCLFASHRHYWRFSSWSVQWLPSASLSSSSSSYLFLHASTPQSRQSTYWGALSSQHLPATAKHHHHLHTSNTGEEPLFNKRLPLYKPTGPRRMRRLWGFRSPKRFKVYWGR